MVRTPLYALFPKPTLFTAVYNASWSALYDVRVSMNKTNKPVELVYKAAITQSTGEPWDDVPIILETATPTDNVTVPRLDPWRVSVYTPPLPTLAQARPAYQVAEEQEESDEDMGFGLFDDGIPSQSAPAPKMAVTSALVVSQGNITATFRVPGRTTVPSDGAVHSVTIAKLDLDAAMEWVAIPKKDPRTHLKVSRTFSSTYSLHITHHLAGPNQELFRLHATSRRLERLSRRKFHRSQQTSTS